MIERIKTFILEFSFLSPFLFVAFFVLSGFHEMQDCCEAAAVIIPLVFIEIIALSLFLLFRRVSGSVFKSALVVNVILLPLLFFGPALEFIGNPDLIERLSAHKVLLILLPLLILVFSVLLIRSNKKFNRSNSLLFVYTHLLVVIELFKIGAHSFNRNKLYEYTHRNEAVDLPAKLPGQLPDVYYLVFDMHAGYESLNQFFNYSDTSFIHMLESKGFCVVKNAKSNYNVTLYSLASSLNMQHLNRLPELESNDMAKECVLADLIKNNKVYAIFDAMGYDLINLSLFDMHDQKRFYSQFYPFSLNIHLFEKTVFSKKHLQIILYKTIMHDKILGIISSGDSGNHVSTKAIVNELSIIPDRLGAQRKPAFIYAHFLIPHWPYVFDRNGNINFTDHKYEDKEKYLEQLIYTDKLITQITDSILSKSKTPPVIIIQGDHGFNKFTDKNSFEASTNILNAYYFPDGCKDKIYEAITPVNSFAVVFNSVFGFEIQLKDDKSYNLESEDVR